MFTGIIQATGQITGIEPKGDDCRFTFNTGDMSLTDLKVGDSIAVNGACLTIIEMKENEFMADLSRETLNLTTFAKLKQGDRINLEKAMQLSDRLNGHLVSGHVDGVCEVVEKTDEGRSIRFLIKAPEKLLKYISRKGSVCVDGVSLTVNDINADVFSLNIIPHTLSETIFDQYEVGANVNLEVDLIARYLEQLITRE